MISTIGFNSFLRTFLDIFEASFPVKYTSIHSNENGWITQGICIYSRDSHDVIIKGNKRIVL